MSEYEPILRTVAPDSREAVDADLLEALNRGRLAAGLAPRSLALWSWWLACPDGACVGHVRDGDGAVRALIVGLRHGARLRDESVRFLEVVDVFNAFELGAGLSRAKHLLALGRAFADEYGGPAPAHPVMYGVPTRRAHRLGLRHLGFEILRSENKLCIDPDAIPPAPSGGAQVEEPERFPAGVESVFLTAMEGREAVLVRDAERLDWRFRAHPEHGYRCAVARRGEELCGHAVYLCSGWDGAEQGLLCEWMVPVGDGEARHALLAWAAARAREDGVERLTVAVPERSPEWAVFQDIGFRVHGTHDYLVFRSFQKPYVMSWLFQHWFYTLSDSQRC